MKQNFLFIAVLLLGIIPLKLQAQVGENASAFSSAFGQAGNVSFTLGQPFGKHVGSSSGVELNEGVQQAQVIYNHIALDGCQNDENVSLDKLEADYKFFRGYNSFIPFNGVDLHILPAGHYDSTDVASRHYNWGARYNYDSVTTMVLDVWPIYEKYDTISIDVSEAHGFHEGNNDRFFPTSDHGCDSLVHYFVVTCGDKIKDANGNIYDTHFIGPYCWTKQNMRATHYTNGELIANAMIYSSPDFPNENANLQQYGYLYSWYSAVHLPEGSIADPVFNEKGYVQGLCPKGWHIPTELNMRSLISFGSPALKSTILWIEPGNNSTEFTAYPAGIYNPTVNRFENMLGETRYWTAQSEGAAFAKSGALSHFCNELFIDTKTKKHGFSVRCVKD